MKTPKGILLAGGTGSRMFPLTAAMNKHLLPVYDKPLIYYSLATLMFAGAREVALVTNEPDVERFQRLLGHGEHLGIQISYVPQPTPRGIGDGLARCSDFIGRERCVVVLGDNLFHGAGFGISLEGLGSRDEAIIYAYSVADPRPYAVVEISAEGQAYSLVEKPKSPTSNWAVPGIYFLPPGAATEAAGIPLSDRGESEITDLNRRYLEMGILQVKRASRGAMWMDVGSPERLFAAAAYVESVVKRQGLSISCPEEVAFRKGWISRGALASTVRQMPDSAYAEYLRGVVGARRGG